MICYDEDKACTRCQQIKAAIHFRPIKGRPGKREAYCEECRYSASLALSREKARLKAQLKNEMKRQLRADRLYSYIRLPPKPKPAPTPVEAFIAFMGCCRAGAKDINTPARI